MVRASHAYSVGRQRRNRILFGYQYKQMEFDVNGATTDIRLSGITAGFDFRF